jgi:hypothetical protein
MTALIMPFIIYYWTPTASVITFLIIAAYLIKAKTTKD